MGTSAAGQGWRAELLYEALTATSQDLSPHNLLLAGIARRWPAAHSLVLNRCGRLEEFLRAQGYEARSLLSASHREVLWNDLETAPTAGWIRFVAGGGVTLELVTGVGLNSNNLAVLLAEAEAPLLEFARAYHAFQERPTKRALRFSHGWEPAPDLDEELGRTTWEDLVLPPATVTGLRSAIEGFAQHRAAFEALGFPWRRGVLLVGPPGTGKTLVCKAAASTLKELPFLYVRDLTSQHHGQEPLSEIFDRARALSPCILAFEDIDGLVTDSRRSIFLNELDGFAQNQGLLVLASSNHPERIDEALLKRPSRFDRVFHLGLPALAEREEYGRRLLARSKLHAHLDPALELSALVRRVAERTDGFTPAYLKEVYLAAALERAQAGAMRLDRDFAEATLAQVELLREQLRKVRAPEALAELRSEERVGFTP